MSFTYEMNKLMLIDGIVFMLPGISMMLLPSPQSRLKDKLDARTALPPFSDIRFLLGAAYIAMGLVVAGMGGGLADKAALNDFAKFRAVSLVFIVYALLMQILSKKWKWSGYRLMYLILYSLLLLTYAFLGFIDPMPIY